MGNHDEETIELESQPLNTEKKGEIVAAKIAELKEKLGPIGLTKEELMKYAKDPFWCKLRKILFYLFWLLWLSMFVGAFLIIHYVPSCPATSRLKWFQRESVAQLNLDLFHNKVNNISDNLTPFMNVFQTRTFLLPNLFAQTIDNDIINHLELDPKFGTIDDLSKLVKKLKVDHESNAIMDLNAATTGRGHPWFKAFMAQEDKYANYYLLANSDYVDYLNYEKESISGGRTLITKQSKPCLNLLDKDVRAEFKKIFDKWGRLNIKGFRLLGAPYLLTNQENKKVSKDLELNQKLIKEWSKEFKKAVSDGVLILQLDDQDDEDYSKYYGTQEEPIADIVVNKFVSRLDLASNSTSEIKNKLQTYLNSTKPWNDDLSNIGPWTGWLIDDLNEKRNKDDLLVCFGNILGYTLPRGMPITRLSFNILHIGLADEFLKVIKEFTKQTSSYDNARLFAKLAALRKSHADSIMLGKTEFPTVNLASSGQQTDDVFAMIRTNDKQGLILLSNLKGNTKEVKLDLDFNRIPRIANAAANCRLKDDDRPFGARIELDKPFKLKLNETFVATFETTF